MSQAQPLPMPEGAPQPGEVYQHYKGDHYKVVSLALHSNDDEWMVAYEPLYEPAAAKLFVRPLSEWATELVWEGKPVVRFSKVS